MRIDRVENALRQLTGTVEQLQYRNQQLEMQVKRLQDDTDYRLRQLGSKGGQVPAHAPGVPPAATAPATPGRPGERSDAFNPAQHPTAPGAPRSLNSEASIATPPPADQPIGAPGGRAAGAPLDLSTLAANPPGPPGASEPAAPMSSANPVTAAPVPAASGGGRLPPPPPRNPSATGAQLATLPPSSSPKDEYDLAYGYVLHKDYALAEQAFRDFLRKYPNERLVPDAQYWLGESLYQRQRFRDAAEAFLAVSTKYTHAGKAPNALLRLGQSLAAMHQKQAACATLGEVGRKYPKASVKREARRRAGTQACPLLTQRSCLRRKPNRFSPILFLCRRWCWPFPADRIRPR